MNKIILGAVGAVATILTASAATAATAVIDGITVSDFGRVNPAGPDYAQPGVGTGTAQIQIGQVSAMPLNPPEFSNPGWSPYGLSDTAHSWWNIEGGQVTFNRSGDALTIVWGSPNDNNPAATNTVSFYTGANGTGSLIGRVLASDLYSKFGVDNTQDPGYLVSFMTPKNFGSVVFTTGSSDFEFSAVPETSTWAMIGIGFVGLAALAGRKRQRNRLAPALG